MRALLFGATGMVGQGVLRECLADPDVTEVLAVGRAPSGVSHPKLRDLVRADLFDLAPVADALAGYDACFWCLGVSAAGKSEAEYARTTYELTLAAARVLAARNPRMAFVYVSGAGTDGTEKGRSMWARVKGRTENALFALPFRAFAFRPGFIQPMHGERSRTGWYRATYAVTRPLVPLLRRVMKDSMLTTEQVGRAMIAVAKRGAPKRVLEAKDIAALARAPAA
ncbi:MAG TPA: NAD(P)H-binding protein [Candidatus Thermoplasmatota archaeon]|nr:NAD(P)H-binding protein [Candidatus Thermoplasmatota archaeon]